MSHDCNFTWVDNLMRGTLQPMVQIPTFILGLLLNLLAILRFSSFLKKRWAGYMATSIYMINLAIFDLLLVLSLPFRMYLSWNEQSSSICTLAECLYFISMYGSIFTICFISLDRFLAIQFPLQASHFRSPQKSFWICGVIWVLVWVGSTPVYRFHEGKNSRTECFRNMSEATWSSNVMVPLELFGFFLPMSVVGFCSFKTIFILLGRRDQTQDWVQQKACIWTIAVNLAVFVVSFLPVHLAFFLHFLAKRGNIERCETQENISLFMQLALCFSNTNCCLDVFCYYFVIKEFRAGIRAHRPSRVQLVQQDNRA